MVVLLRSHTLESSLGNQRFSAAATSVCSGIQSPPYMHHSLGGVFYFACGDPNPFPQNCPPQAFTNFFPGYLAISGIIRYNRPIDLNGETSP